MEDVQPFTINELFKKGWELTKANLVFLIVYQLILWALFGLNAFLENKLFLGLIVWVAAVIAKLGFYKSCILIVNGIKPEFDQLYINWKKTLTWLIASILFGLMFAVGFILLIIPGFYVMARYGLYTFFVVDKNLGPIEAIQVAGRATKGIRWEIFLLFMASILVNIVGLLLFVVGLLITIPMTMLAFAEVYRRIQSRAVYIAP